MLLFKLFLIPQKQVTSTTKLALESDGMEAFVMADCAESVLTQEADDPVDRILPDATPRFSKSPVLRCFFNFKPWHKTQKLQKYSIFYSEKDTIKKMLGRYSFTKEKA